MTRNEGPGADQFRRELSLVFGGLLVLAVLGLIVFVVAPVPATSPYTEFYVVNASGEAAEYPATVGVGEEIVVTVGIVNNEHRRVTYDFVVRTNGTQIERQSVTLADGDTLERQVGLSFDDPGEHRVVLYLYLEGQSPADPYRRLRLVFQVTDR